MQAESRASAVGIVEAVCSSRQKARRRKNRKWCRHVPPARNRMKLCALSSRCVQPGPYAQNERTAKQCPWKQNATSVVEGQAKCSRCRQKTRTCETLNERETRTTQQRRFTERTVSAVLERKPSKTARVHPNAVEVKFI